MAPPRRSAPLGTLESVVDDLTLARDAVGFERCGADRLQGTLQLLYGGGGWGAEQVTNVRRWLGDWTRYVCGEWRDQNPDDPCAQAAANSLESILTQPADGRFLAHALRRNAQEAAGCHIAADSVRKREQPLLNLIAEKVYYQTHTRPVSELPSLFDLLHWMKPYAELAGLCVAEAADLGAMRPSLPDPGVIDYWTARALWAVARLGTMPAYARQALAVTGASGIEDEALEHYLFAVATAPFQEEPTDLYELAATNQPDNLDDAETYLAGLAETRTTAPLVERFKRWLGLHDPKLCQYKANYFLVGYCGPHYFASLCELFSDMVDDYQSGELRAEFLGYLDQFRNGGASIGP